MRKYLSKIDSNDKIRLLKNTVLFLMISGNISGQQSLNNDNNLNKIIPSTAETYSMFKAGDFPVDYRTGKLNVSVPIYNINTKYGISIPINLTYNTGGIKVDETSSTVGLGWSLAIPNSISVEQHGKSDLTNIVKWFPTNPFDYVYNNVDLESLPADIRTKLYALAEGVQDMQPDIFHYNLPTISGSFIMDSNGNFHTIPYDNIKISYSNANNTFQITDSKGILYTLGSGNIIASATGLSADGSSSSFLLSNIKLPTNEEISFKYEKRMSYQTTTHSYQDVYAPIEGYEAKCRAAAGDIHTVTVNNYVDKLLTEIKYGNETINFNYKNTIDGILGRKDIKAANLENTFALDEILVSNSAGNIVRNYKLNHTYFNSGSGSDYRNYRLKLTKIDNLLENNKYSFEYNEAYKPAIESFAQDIWGYYNGKTDNIGLIPNMRYFNINYTKGGDRNVYPEFSQAFILKKIAYPTGGTSAFDYESNTVWDKLLIPEKRIIEYGTINNNYINTQNEYEQITMATPPNEYFYIDVNRLNREELWAEFFNSCSNQVSNQFPDNESSMGTAYLEEFINNHWEILAVFNGADTTGALSDNRFFLNPQAPKRIRTTRKGNCFVYLRIYKIKYDKENGQNNPVGGLRIKSITDFDGSMTYTKRQFEYNNPNLSGNRSSAYFVSPLEFIKNTYKVIRNTGYDVDDFCSPYALGADQAINSSLAGKEVVNYEYVTEHNSGKRRKLFKYGYVDNSMNLTTPDGSGFNPYQLSNHNLLSEISYEQNGNTPLKEINYLYTSTYFKNALSSNYSSNNLSQVIPSTVLGIYKILGGTLQNDLYITKILSHYPIESGKFLLNEVQTKDYINGKIITTKINSEYSLSDIQKPINLMKETTQYSDGQVFETSYEYPYEKNNLKLINSNMISIPLETKVVKKQNIGDVGKIITKTEVKYDNSSTLLPTSILSYDLQTGVSSTELIYDQYDSKGNIIQYTTKGGISVSIIWGYDKTKPIAKIEGAKIYDIPQALIDSIVNASNTDAISGTDASEQSLIAALDAFRNNAGLSAFQISTYTYDPLIGVRSITPPSGIREVYKYDSANRLEKVVDANGKVLKEYQYHYKN
ncbi:hypothetical protein N6B72_02885 [Chryseobacterium soli]|uniref:hypothetical protein n=1 Tax=Chryseobacterium soli TaxID=445961 RepID=UPI00295419C5|nr:hypothetical protein [Chryseobacterium soli]MDV7695857.1 hypothetical protein [Chryseobacterium soli]